MGLLLHAEIDAEGNGWWMQEKMKSLQNTVNLLTSTVKSDAEEGGEPLKFCFRVVAPDKAYTLQADNEMDRRDWMEAVQVPRQTLCSMMHVASIDFKFMVLIC